MNRRFQHKATKRKNLMRVTRTRFFIVRNMVNQVIEAS